MFYGYTRANVFFFAYFSIKGARRDAREREFQFLQRERLSEICYSIVEDRPVILHCYDTIYNIRDTLFGELWKCMVYDSCIFIFSSNYYYLWIQERDGIYLSIT